MSDNNHTVYTDIFCSWTQAYILNVKTCLIEKHDIPAVGILDKEDPESSSSLSPVWLEFEQ